MPAPTFLPHAANVVAHATAQDLPASGAAARERRIDEYLTQFSRDGVLLR
jgi:hypothetical protein